MKALFFLLIFQFVALLAFCQIDSGSIKLLESILRKEHPEGTLYYTDKLDSAQVLYISGYLQKRKFKNLTISKKSVNHKIRLSRKEKKYLDSSVNTLYSICWKDSLFENSKRIPKDSMWAHIQRRNREVYALAMDSTRPEKIRSVNYRVMYSNTFQFCFPVYFRNRSFFLVYFLRMCGPECGVQELSFYKRENDSYKKWVVVMKGDF